MDIENSLLYNGVKIPSLGFGTYPLNEKGAKIFTNKVLKDIGLIN